MKNLLEIEPVKISMRPMIGISESEIASQSANFPYGKWAMSRGKYYTRHTSVVDLGEAQVYGHTGFISNADGFFKPSLTQVFQDDYLSRVSENRRQIGRRWAGTYASIFNWFGRNYWHWHLQCLPNILLLENAGLLDEATLVVPELRSWQRASLMAMGIHPGKFLEIGDSGHVFERLIYCSFASGHADDLHPLTVETFARIQQNLQIEPSADDKLFVSRADSRLRVMVNENELRSALENYGYKTVVAGDLSYTEQVRAFSQARFIVGAHGAGLTNAGFSRGALFEICPDTYFRVGFAVQSTLLQQPYTFRTYPAFRNGKENISQMPDGLEWAVDIDDLLQRLKLFESQCSENLSV